MTDQIACPTCGKLFTPWRGQVYCSERCRKNAQNERLGYVRRSEATTLPADGLGGLGDALSVACQRISGMVNPTIEAIRRELEGRDIVWDERMIQKTARMMRVAPTAVRNALGVRHAP